MSRLSIRISDALDEALRAAAHELQTSKSEIARSTLRDNLLEGDLEEALEPHVSAKLRREQSKSEHELVWQRIHFPSNSKDRILRAWKQGDLNPDLNPGAIEDLIEIQRDDALILFDDADRLESNLEYLDRLEQAAREAEQASDLDPLDPDEIFSEFEGVDREQTRAEEIPENIGIALEQLEQTLSQQREDPALVADEEAALDGISTRFNVDRELLADAAANRGIIDE